LRQSLVGFGKAKEEAEDEYNDDFEEIEEVDNEHSDEDEVVEDIKIDTSDDEEFDRDMSNVQNLNKGGIRQIVSARTGDTKPIMKSFKLADTKAKPVVHSETFKMEPPSKITPKMPIRPISHIGSKPIPIIAKESPVIQPVKQ